MQRRTILEIFGGLVLTGTTLGLSRQQAETDKQAAIDQMAAQVADNGDYALTWGFHVLSQKYPWLATARNSVGSVAYANDSSRGSAVLWDRYGTIVLSAHEWDTSPLNLRFYLKDTKVVVDILECLKDDKHDLLFASIDPKVISRNKLLPVERGKMGFEGKEAGQTIINVGFPSLSRRLHATEGTVGNFISNLQQTNGDQLRQVNCKIENTGITFPGMSGCAVFHEGQLVGIHNTGKGELGLGAAGTFTPVDLITNAYCDLYPDRAKRAGITPIADEVLNAPSACKIDRRNFVRASFKTPQN
jgi:hypothetical protein